MNCVPEKKLFPRKLPTKGLRELVYFQFKNGVCVQKVMILGHSFVQRLHKDLKDNFDDRTKQNSDLQHAYIQLFGVEGRIATVPKVLQ